MLFLTSNYFVTLADNRKDIIAAQNLRYRMFYEERGIEAPQHKAELERDFDWHDPHCDHLLVIYHGDNAHDVVGNYRLLRDTSSAECGFASASEFDLSPFDNFTGTKVELGRACVDPAHRKNGVAQLLWRGLATYIYQTNVDLLFGLASIPGTAINEVSPIVSYLQAHHSSTEKWAPAALKDNRLAPLPGEGEQLSKRDALMSMPPLLKAYLRLGGEIGHGAYIDRELQTTDVLIMLETDAINERYQKHFMAGAAEVSRNEALAS